MKDMLKEGRVGKAALPKGNKLERVMEVLREIAGKQAAAGPQPAGRMVPAGAPATGGAAMGGAAPPVLTAETIADDGDVSAEKAATIATTEAVLRPALHVFGIDYDALIKMDGASPYAQAVAAKPGVLQEVLSSDNPVLSALKVAEDYKPYAEFAAAYGTEPSAIKEKIAAEALAHEAKAAAPQPKGKGVVFSSRYAPRRESAARTAGLGSVFGK
ncbi:MAG: hypothetical protein COY40_04605 [Alphaproteobacteria bacterium CG_4_10_14_0_8_um_filter_53_9]|nr:MAG: hypothetical protein COY40_04605 [Alphaproteobacteria bacterium CG_4_10_14_0_8_um_filter_53_9]